MQGIRKTLLSAAVVTTLFVPGAAQSQTQVDMALSLLVDVSGSVSNTQFELQRSGYVAAFNSSALWTAIEAGALDRIAVNFIYWSAGQSTAIGWTLIDSEASMNAFASAIAATTRPSTGLIGNQTGLGDALAYGGDSFALLSDVNLASSRYVIDVSGDGCRNEGIGTLAGRASAVADGVDVINGIVIDPLNDPVYCDAAGSLNVEDHYNQRVKYGTGSFVNSAATFDDFEAAIEDKLVREITGTVTPEPVTMTLLGTGLAGIAAARRRRKQERNEA